MNPNPEQDEECAVGFNENRNSDLSDNPQTAEEVRPVIAVNSDQTVFAEMWWPGNSPRQNLRNLT